MISNMMLQAQVTEEQLKESQEIKTETGVVLSWKYLCWVREHPVKSICKETNILYGTQDEMIPYKIVKRFEFCGKCAALASYSQGSSGYAEVGTDRT